MQKKTSKTKHENVVSDSMQKVKRGYSHIMLHNVILTYRRTHELEKLKYNTTHTIDIYLIEKATR